MMTPRLDPKSHPVTLRGRIVEMDRPRVMGILNATPDSFYGPSREMDPEEAVARAGAMLRAGADIIDIGGCSTRPGSEAPSPEEELRRLSGVLEAVRSAYPEAVVSVDTYRASVAEACLESWDVDIVNDVSGGADPEMFPVVARHKAAYVLMHMRGTQADMDTRCVYGDVVAEVVSELSFRVNEARDAGICNLFVDPGFGFAKTPEQNFELLDRLGCLEVLGCPVLVGLSRKRFVREGAGVGTEQALIPTVALNAVAMSKGAAVVRVHDVEEAVLTARTVGKLWNSD